MCCASQLTVASFAGPPPTHSAMTAAWKSR